MCLWNSNKASSQRKSGCNNDYFISGKEKLGLVLTTRFQSEGLQKWMGLGNTQVSFAYFDWELVFSQPVSNHLDCIAALLGCVFPCTDCLVLQRCREVTSVTLLENIKPRHALTRRNCWVFECSNTWNQIFFIINTTWASCEALADQ